MTWSIVVVDITFETSDIFLSFLREDVAFYLLAESGERMGLMVNDKKTKYMFVGQTRATLSDQITIKDYLSTAGERHIS